MSQPGATAKTKINRLSNKASHSQIELYSILDANLVAHVGIIFDDKPLVIPMAYARIGDLIYLHGSSGSRLMRALAAEPEVCVSITEFNAVKVARSTFNSGMHYRSVVIFGKAELTPDEDKDSALNAISDAMIPGRVKEVRASTKKELAATFIISVSLEETSVKIAVNQDDDDPGDVGKGTWSGIIPFITSIGEIIPADEEAAGLEIPQSVKNFRTGSSKAH
jgi:nitroimidazol reductase NimA-like FMN-containing flavoprotein (pyridoxamine 5'-phosphate oxidase superfamily)